MDKLIPLSLLVLVSAAACSNPQPGPDKTAAGAVLGAAWGAGAGAVVGHQAGTHSGEGAAIGSGFGAVAGALSGYSYDRMEDTQIKQEQELASLQVRNMANSRMLEGMQGKLDAALGQGSLGGVYQVFFDDDATSMKAGAISNLQIIADSIKSNPHAGIVHVVGNADDAGTPDYNKRLAEARAREVSSYLMARGISADQIKVSENGSERPIATNSTPIGRQLNRRVDIYITSR